MIQIPKLVKGAIIDNYNIATLGDRKSKHLIYDKYYKIYKHTKNRRIKKKQEKKSLILYTRNILENMQKRCGISEILINGVKINEDR